MIFQPITKTDKWQPGDQWLTDYDGWKSCPEMKYFRLDDLVLKMHYRRPVSEPVYRVKPLVWIKKYKDDVVYYAESAIGRIEVYQLEKEWLFELSGGCVKTNYHDTIDAAKLAAESYYRERMMAALEEVK